MKGQAVDSLFAPEVDFQVSRRPEPIPIDARRSWRVATIVLALASSRGNRAGREKLLLLNYALRNPETQDSLADVLSGVQSPFFLEVRVDPGHARALDFAIGLGLVRRAGTSSVELTPTGIDLAAALNSDDSIAPAHKRFLARIRRLATEGRIREILKWR
jgi:hypothetical protein